MHDWISVCRRTRRFVSVARVVLAVAALAAVASLAGAGSNGPAPAGTAIASRQKRDRHIETALPCRADDGVSSGISSPGRRSRTLEDIYDSEAGNRIQAAFGFIVFEGSNSNPADQSYGAAIDDVTIEWSESHPVQQAAAAGCGGGTCSGGPRAGKLCFNTDDCGAGGTCSGATAAAQASCAAISWGTNSLFNGSGVVALNLVDFNAETTQGTFDCTRYGITSGCGGGNCSASNDCDNDGLKEVEVSIQSSSETSPELFRLEQTASGASSYSTAVAFSSALNAANDGVFFLQYNGTAQPTVTATYFDRDAGSADTNGDGTPNSPPGNGLDRCPGSCGFDDDRDAVGPDRRPGEAIKDDDANGVCNFKATNAGAPCVTNSGCPAGICLTIDEPDELCVRTCAAGSTSGLCSVGSGNVGAVCTAPGTASSCTGGGTCVAINCNFDGDCGVAGNCPGICYNGSNSGAVCHQPADCTSGAVGGVCGRAVPWGDDDCALIDEPDEQCAVVAGRLVSGIDDNCGCSQNPLSAVLNAFFDTADLIIQSFAFSDNGDHDGFADDNELVSMNLTLRNIGSVDLDDVQVRLSSSSPEIQCINDAIARYGRINALQSASNGGDLLQFTVGNVHRTSLAEIKQATLTVTATGTAVMDDGSRVQIQGTTGPQTITIDLDLDASTASPPVAKTTRIFGFEATAACIGGANNGLACTTDANCPGGACPRIYATGADFDSDWFHTFVTDHDGLHCQYNDPSGLLARSAPFGCFLRQDSGTQVPDDWHLHSTVTGGKQSDGGRDSGTPGSCVNGKFPGSACSQPQDCVGGCTGAHAGQGCASNADCAGTCSNDPLINCTSQPRCRFCNNDHAITCTSSVQCAAVGGSCGSPGTCNGIGACTNPPPGSCMNLGNACMHEGVHFGGDVANDSVHLDNIFSTYYKGDDQGGGVRTPLQIGLGRPGIDDPPILSWWQSMALLDERAVGGLGEPYSLDAGVMHILVDRNNDGTLEVGPGSNPNNDGFWEKVKPYYGAPRQQRFPTGNCQYDPDDDGNNEDDIGPTLTPQNNRATGPSSTCFPEFVWACAGDTQDDPYLPGLGQSEPNAICFPEVDANDSPIVRRGNGPGRWVETRVDLSKYRGRKIWFRYLTSHIQFGGCTWSGPNGGCSVFGGPFGGNRDDGWYIDDLRVSGTSTPFSLAPDNDAPPASSCPAVLCGAPTSLTARFTGSTYVTQHDGIDNDGNGLIDETDDGAATSVASDAPLRTVGLNGQDFNSSTGTCINGVLQYRFWEDRDNDNVLDLGELLRDFTEDPTLTAAPLCTEHIKMDLRCSSAPSACSSSADLLVTVAGRVGPFATVKVASSKTTMTWDAFAQAAAYDVAYRRIATPSFSGDFSAFAPATGGTCTNSCSVISPTYTIGQSVCAGGTNPGANCRPAGPDCTGGGVCTAQCKGTPPVGNLDMWVLRSVGAGSPPAWVSTWDEGGAQVGSRDVTPPFAPQVNAGIPGTVCPH